MTRAQNRTTSLVIVALAAALALVLGACSKGPDLTRAKARAFELLGQQGPKVSGLIGRQADLKARLAALPAELPGVAEAAPALEATQAKIAELKGLLDGYAVLIDKAAQSGKEEPIDAVGTGFEGQMIAGVDETTKALDAAEKKIKGLEAAVNPAPPAVEGGDADAGDGGAAGGAAPAAVVPADAPR